MVLVGIRGLAGTKPGHRARLDPGLGGRAAPRVACTGVPMARRTNDRIRVECSTAGPPAGFRLGWRRYRVQAVLASWVEPRSWWRDGHAARSVVWRVEAAHGTTVGTYDLSETTGIWRLVRVAD